MYNIVEKFVSINGEGSRAGELAVFIRFAHCNLKCSYCDTAWANESDIEYEKLSKEEIYKYIKSSKAKNVTLTGGEPLMQIGIFELLEYLTNKDDISVEIETNGSVDFYEFQELENPPIYTMDYKLPSSEMEEFMFTGNLNFLTKKDIVKFVVGTKRDLTRAKQIIDEYELTCSTNVYISGVYGEIQASDVVEFMIENNMNNVRLQLQMHKYIWEPNKKGV